MSFGKLTDGFRADFTAALALQGKKPTNEVYQECMKVLKDHKVSYTVDAKPAYFLVHKENRGRLMLSPHNAHRNCLSIHKVGADMTQLINAVAMELPAAGRARDEQFIANERLVKAADGLLPSINSEERYATLGCGHTAAICKLAGQDNPKTPIAELRDEHGNLNVAKLKQNPQFKTMIEDGWSWIIIPALVDELFPAFAKIAQKALNTSNHVGIAVGELETQLQLSDLVDDNGFTENNKDWEALAVNFVEDLCVPCGPYAKHLLHFVKLYGGGPGAPHIRLMDNVAKTFQCTHVCLGPTFWQAISTAVFYDKTNLHVLTRNALCMVNLTSSIKEDGIAKLITKNDISKLTSKLSVQRAANAEKSLQDGMQIVEALVRGTSLTVDDFVQCIGKLFVRVGLWCTNNMKKGSEGKERSLDEIKGLFSQEVSAVAGGSVQLEGWTAGPVHVDDDGPGLSNTQISASMSDHSNPVWIAKHNGFEVGALVCQRYVDLSAGNIFNIVDITAERAVKLKQACSFTGSPVEASIPLEELIAKWCPSSKAAQLPQKLPVSQARTGLGIDMMKGKLLEAICAVDSMTQLAQSLEFWKNPWQVRTGSAAIHAGALVLAPVVPLMQITTKSSGNGLKIGSFEVDGEAVDFFAVPSSKTCFGDDTMDKLVQDGKQPLLAAFWWVAEKPNKKEANMEITVKEAKGKSIPILQNTVELPPFTQLVRYVPEKKEKQVKPLCEAVEPKKKAARQR